MDHTLAELDANSWDALADLVQRNNGIYGGCWCIGYHPECGQQGIDHRAVKEQRVRTDRAHVSLVIDDEGEVQGWCQWGTRLAPLLSLFLRVEAWVAGRQSIRPFTSADRSKVTTTWKDLDGSRGGGASRVDCFRHTCEHGQTDNIRSASR